MAGTKKGGSGELEAIMPGICSGTGCNDWEQLRKPLFCRDCTVHFLRSGNFRLPALAVKTFPADAKGLQKAKKLQSLQERTLRLHRTSGPRFSVPEPVLLPDLGNALVMEYIDAPMASLLLRQSFFSGGKKEDIIRKCAGWLRWFHEQSDVAVEPFEAARFLGKLEKSLEKIHALNPAAIEKNPFLGKCIARVESVAKALDGTAMHHAAVHGDFTPFNVFIGGEQVVGIDYQDGARLPLSHDICRFLLYLDFTRIARADRAELRKFGCRQRNIEVFLDAYGRDRALLDPVQWLAFNYMEVVRRITSLVMMQQRGRKRPFRHIEMGSLHRSARHMMAALA